MFGSKVNNFVALAGGGRGPTAPLLMPNVINVAATVATDADSAILPPSSEAEVVILANIGVKSLRVYGSGPNAVDTVNGAASIDVMPNSLVIFFCVVPGAPGGGKWLALGAGIGFNGSFQTLPTAGPLVAFAGGGQASATPITATITRFGTVATIADSGKLPAAKNGSFCTVINDAANSMNVFPSTGDSINAIAANGAYALAGGKTAEFACSVDGKWHAVLSA